MNLINKLTNREIMLFENIDIKITDKDYTLQEIMDKIILNGEITAVENNEYIIAKQYGDLSDKLIKLEEDN